MLADFHQSNSILNTIVVYTATFGDPFNTLIGWNFIFDPIDIVHVYVEKIRALLENQIQLWGVGTLLRLQLFCKDILSNSSW